MDETTIFALKKLICTRQKQYTNMNVWGVYNIVVNSTSTSELN